LSLMLTLPKPSSTPPRARRFCCHPVAGRGLAGACRVTCNEGEVALDLPKHSALSDADRAAGDILLCCAKALTDLKLIAPFDCAAVGFSSLPLRSARILEKSPAGANAVRLVLQQDDVPMIGRAASFTTGQFLELSIPETSTTRIYSMANTPNSEGILEFLVRLYPGGVFSNYLEGRARIGDPLLLRGPKGSFTIDLASDAPRWFVAGGTGLAPILSMLRQMARSGDQRRSRLFFGVNIENELFALSAIDELKRALPRLRTTICVWMPGSE
jgi:NAD(P)H-flavin reductase